MAMDHWEPQSVCPVSLSVPLSVCFCGHSNFVIFHPISSKFHIHVLIASIKLSPKFKYGFCQTNDNQFKIANKMAATCGFALWDTLNLLSPDFFQISFSN